jgi:DNA-binding FadR family transcriptional regulator
VTTIGQVKARATYELVVEQLRRAFALGRFNPGDRMPPERELAAQLGVSRTTLREAVRVLEGEGALEVKRGARGGIIVLDRTSRKLTQGEREEQAEQFTHVMEFRLANETAAAELAAKRRIDDDVEKLRALAEEFKRNEREAHATDDPDEGARLTTEFTVIDHEFHMTIAQASRNPFLCDAVQLGRENMLRPVGTVFVHLHRLANYQHDKIAQSIIAKDGRAAADAMAEHLESTRTQVSEALFLDGKP